MEQNLAGFCDFAADRLGVIRFSRAGERFCFYLAPEAAAYVHENKEKDVFIFELVKLLQKKIQHLTMSSPSFGNGITTVL